MDEGEAERLGWQRNAQLQALTGEELWQQIEQHRQAKWRPRSLARHVAKHRRDFAISAGVLLTEESAKAFTLEVLTQFDRVFTELDVDGAVTFLFARMRTDDAAIMVATRGGHVRTLFFVDSVRRWLRRHRGAVEVSDRVK